MNYIFSAKSALHHQAAAHGRGPVQGEGEGRRERQTLRDRVRGRGRARPCVSYQVNVILWTMPYNNGNLQFKKFSLWILLLEEDLSDFILRVLIKQGNLIKLETRIKFMQNSLISDKTAVHYEFTIRNGDWRMIPFLMIIFHLINRAYQFRPLKW